MKKKFLWNDTTTICCCYLETSILSHPKTFNSHRISWGELIRQISSLLVAQTVKNLPAMWETQVWSWVRKIPWRREWLPTPVSGLENSMNRGTWQGYSPWGHKELDTTTHTHTHTHTHTNEKNLKIYCPYIYELKKIEVNCITFLTVKFLNIESWMISLPHLSISKYTV